MMESISSSGLRPPRPITVTYALYLMIGAYIAAAVLWIFDLITLQLAPGGPDQTTAISPWYLLCFAVVIPVELAIAYGIWRGLGWPRLAYAVLILAALWSWISGDVVESFSAQPTRAVLGAATLLAHIVAAVLLFAPASSAWFREARAGKPVAKAMTPERSAESLPSDIRLSDSRTRWMPLAVSVVLILLLSWPAYSSGFRSAYGLYLSRYDLWLCLPVQAIAMFLGALIGARSAGVPSARWKRATYGLWVGGLIAIALRVCAAPLYEFGAHVWRSL